MFNKQVVVSWETAAFPPSILDQISWPKIGKPFQIAHQAITTSI